eukprot:jgi/Mesvir1/25383/Mv01423-RA.1
MSGHTIVFYSTTMRAVRKTFEECNTVRMMFENLRVNFDERDISMHAEYREELKALMGKPVPVPRVFINGEYLGGFEELEHFNEEGTLARILEQRGVIPGSTKPPTELCTSCGGKKFVMCTMCSGGCKIVGKDGSISRCENCNENGLVRCSACA